MTDTTTPKQAATIRKKLVDLYVRLIDYLLSTVRDAKPGQLKASLLMVVRLVIHDAGIDRAVRTQAEARRAMQALKGDADAALSLPFNGPATKQ